MIVVLQTVDALARLTATVNTLQCVSTRSPVRLDTLQQPEVTDCKNWYNARQQQLLSICHRIKVKLETHLNILDDLWI